MDKSELIQRLKDIVKELESSDDDMVLHSLLVYDGNDNWECTDIVLNDYSTGFDLEMTLTPEYTVSLKGK